MKKARIVQVILAASLISFSLSIFIYAAMAIDPQTHRMESDRAMMNSIQDQIKAARQQIIAKHEELARASVDKAFAGLKTVPVGVTSGVYTGVYGGSVRALLAECARIYLALGDYSAARSAIEFGIEKIPSVFGDQTGLPDLIQAKAELAQRHGDKVGSARLEQMAELRRQLNALRSIPMAEPSAMRDSQAAVESATKCGDTEMLLEALQYQYNIYLFAKNYKEARTTAERRHKLAKEHDKREAIASSLVDIGDLHAALGKKTEAEQSYLEAIREYKAAGLNGDYVSRRLKAMQGSK